MRVNERYQDVKSGQITELLFLEEVRKDGSLRKFISNRNTFDEAVTILKNKGLLYEQEAPKADKIDFFKMFNEGLAAWEVEEDKTTEVNPFEFEKGWRYEFIKAGKTDDTALQKAKDKAIKNLQKDAIFYTKLELVKDSVEHQKKRTDQPLDISKGQNLVDKDNQAKPVKVKADISSEEYLKAAKAKEEAVLNEGVIKEYADGEEDDYNSIEDVYGKPEISAILKKWDYLGYDLPGEAMNAILSQKNWKEDWDVAGEDPSDLAKVDAWRLQTIKKAKSGIKEDKLPGGQGDKLKPEDVDPKELEMGIKYELDHTKDKKIAQEIALDHLSEDPKYYTKLKTAGIDEGVFSSDPLGKLKGKLVSFTTKNGDQLNSVSSKAVSSKLGKSGEWIITLAGNQTLALTKGGTKGIYFKTKDQHEKVADLGQDLKAAADKVFKSENLDEGSINKDYKFYILSVKDYLVAGFNNSGEATDFIKDHPATGFKKIPAESLSKVTKLDPNQDKSWKKLSGINDFMFKTYESQLKEQIKAVLREKLLKENLSEPNPDLDKENLERELKNYDWYWQNNDDAYLKKLAQERDDKVRNLVDKLGEEGVKLYNEYAPKDLQLGSEVKEDEAKPEIQQQLKDMEDMDPKDLADQVLANKFGPHSVKTKAAAQLLAHAMKTDKDPKIQQAFLKLAGKNLNEGKLAKILGAGLIVAGTALGVNKLDKLDKQEKARFEMVTSKYEDTLMNKDSESLEKLLDTIKNKYPDNRDYDEFKNTGMYKNDFVSQYSTSSDQGKKFIIIDRIVKALVDHPELETLIAK